MSEVIRAQAETTTFPASPVTHHTLLRRVTFLVGLTGVLVVLSLFRQGVHNAFDTFAAEDGNIFFSQATIRSVPDAFGHVYAGYLHLAPRTVAALATLVPLAWAAAVSTVGAAVITSLLAATVFTASAGHLRSWWARIAVSAALILMPVLRVENVNDAMNLQWSLLYTTFWILLWRPRHRAQITVAVLVLLFMTLSQPLSVLFLPLLALRVFALRDRLSVVFAAVMGAGWLVQAVAVERQSTRDTFAGTLTGRQLYEGYAYDLVHGLFPSVSILSDGTVGRSLLLAVLVLLLAACALRSEKRGALVLPALALVTSLGLYLGPVLGGSEVAPRYLVAPALLVLVAMISLVERVRISSLRHCGAALLAAVLVIGWVPSFPVASFRNSGATWSSEVGWAKRTCATQPDDVVIKLWTVPPPWYVDLRCGYVNTH